MMTCSSDVAFEPPHVAFVTLGCAKNEVDTAHMRARLVRAGFLIEDDPARADAVVVNTCSFIQSATEESLEAIFNVAGLPNVSRGAALIVAGCMPARYGEDLAGELSEARAFVPCSREDDIAAVVADALGSSAVPSKPDNLDAPAVPSKADNLDVPAVPSKPDNLDAPAVPSKPDNLDAPAVPSKPDNLDVPVILSGGSDAAVVEGSRVAAPAAVSAYVKISDGCDRFCTYCTIPYIRGRYHSFSLDDVRAEVAAQVAAGVREIVLIAQDTGRWGADFEQPSSLAALVTTLAEQFPQTWFRLMYIQPEGMTDELLDAVAAHNNVCDYFDIPLQHVDAGLLRAMNRSGSREEFLALIDRVLARVPNATLRTTLIAGFPGETDQQFEDLYSFVEEAPFDYVGVFPYSREEGTRAFNLPNQVDEDEKADRAQRLRDVADTVCCPRVGARIGRELDVLVEGFEEDGQLFGRAMCQAPDVDGVTYLTTGAPGEIRRARIVDTLLYEMEGEWA